MGFSTALSYRFDEASIRRYVPAAPGVYGIFTKDRWVYVGQSQDLERRLLEHVFGDNPCVQRHSPTSFMFELAPVWQLDSREAALIRELSPACNLVRP